MSNNNYFIDNRICQLLNIKYPIFQAGMIWCSPWNLASEVSNGGGLGIIGAGSMYPNILEEHIEKAQKATEKNFAVNVPLLYPDIEQLMEIIVAKKVKTVITSAGNPKTWTEILKKNGIKVGHVVSSKKFALKAQAAGVDFIVAEGFEAGGHNGRDETTTLCLIPDVCSSVEIPVVAAGGIASGAAMLATMALGADGVQIGSRFVASKESSAHVNFKNAVIQAEEGETKLTLKQLTPVRLIKNDFYNQIIEAEERCASQEELRQLLGRARAKKGMFIGDMKEGELEIGQISSMISEIKPAKDILDEIINDFFNNLKRIGLKD
ncbi:MAG: nitronate monooxygenase [Flavobacteriales bacterium]|nr:nitronate monooxygenase [Flavobacteriales bacterium]